MTAQAEQLAIDPMAQGRLLLNLFAKWDLGLAEQLTLLGLSANSKAKIYAIREGKSGIAQTQDAQDRAAYLLSIHKGLRLLYPQNPNLLYGWVHLKNDYLHGRTPLEVMIEDHMLGLIRVMGLVNWLRGQ